jgi:hypothetical protein
MSPRKLFIFMMLFVVIATGCQQKNAKKASLRSGRNSRGDFNSPLEPNRPSGTVTSAGQCGSYSVQGKQWGEVTSQAGDQAFMQEINFLMSPVLKQLPQEDQLGYVSSQSNAATGVRFWGHAQSANSSGQGAIDPNSAEIRIEIFDDRACQTRSDGTQRPIIPIHISRRQPDFVRAEGTINGSQVSLYFEDKYGAIMLQGSFSGQYYTGTMSYTVTGYSGSRTLGRFTVPICGFFVCN